MKKLKLLNKEPPNRNAVRRSREKKKLTEKSLDWDRFIDFSLNTRENVVGDQPNSYLSASKLTSSMSRSSDKSLSSTKSGNRSVSSSVAGEVGETMILSSKLRGRKSTESASSNRNLSINTDEIPQTSTIMLPEASSVEDDASTSSNEGDDFFLKKVSVMGNASNNTLNNPQKHDSHVIDNHYLLDGSEESSKSDSESFDSADENQDLQMFDADPLSADDRTSHKKHLSLLRTPLKNRSLAEHLPLSPKSPNIVSMRNQSNSTISRVKPFTINDLSGGTVEFDNDSHSKTKTLPLPIGDNVLLRNTSVAYNTSHSIDDDFVDNEDINNERSNNTGLQDSINVDKATKTLDIDQGPAVVPPSRQFLSKNRNKNISNARNIDSYNQENESSSRKVLTKSRKRKSFNADSNTNAPKNQPITEKPVSKQKSTNKRHILNDDDNNNKENQSPINKSISIIEGNDNYDVNQNVEPNTPTTKRSVSPRSAITAYKNIITEILSPRRILKIPNEASPTTENIDSHTPLRDTSHLENNNDLDVLSDVSPNNDRDLSASPVKLSDIDMVSRQKLVSSALPKKKNRRLIKSSDRVTVNLKNKKKKRQHYGDELDNEHHLRRSSRHRVEPLRYWENEYIDYKRTEEGLSKKKPTEKKSSTKPEKLIEPTPFSIIDPNTSTQEHHYLVWPKQLIKINYKNITSKTPKLQTDTYLKYDNVSVGQVVMKPQTEKGLYLSKDHIIMHVLEGYGIVTIAKKQENISSGTSIIIPKGSDLTV